jgi:hypothetical protein
VRLGVAIRKQLNTVVSPKSKLTKPINKPKATWVEPSFEELDGFTRLYLPKGEHLMAQPTEKEITNRAYKIWERNGKPEGRDEEFWHLAEQELLNEDKSSPLRTPDTL